MFAASPLMPGVNTSIRLKIGLNLPHPSRLIPPPTPAPRAMVKRVLTSPQLW
jgi:hypothetical protein